MGTQLKLLIKATLCGALFVSIQPCLADDIKIGIVPPITGPQAPDGVTQLRAAELAVKKINENGGVNGEKIKLVIVDSKSEPRTAALAMDTLAMKDQVVGVVGPLYSAHIVAMLPAIKKNGVPVLMGGTAPRLSAEGEHWLFRLRTSDSVVAATMVKFIKDELKLKKIAVMHDGSAFGVGGSIQVQNTARELGLEIVKRVQLPDGQKEFKSFYKEFKDAGAEILVVYLPFAEQVAKVMTQWQEVGRPFLLIGSPVLGSQVAQNFAGTATEGVYVTTDGLIGVSAESKQFQTDYRAEYGTDPDSLFAFTYDAVEIFARALKNDPDRSRAKLRDAIANVKNYEGIYGPVKFDSEGNGLHQASIIRIQKGKPVQLKVIHSDL